MIGLIAKPEEHEVAREFFELFKTPWEFYRQEERYDVLLCVSEEIVVVSALEAKLIVVYAGQEQRFDREENIAIGTHRTGGTFLHKSERFPIYGNILTFHGDRTDFLEEEQSRQSAAVRRQDGCKNVVRIGYDLFHEIRLLLSVGQPIEYAGIPTVEIHIALLRDLMVESGVVLIEIPPIPEGYAFIGCLTHDVDHPSIRLHRWDHTALGFLYRALIGSAINVLRGRASVRHLMINWAAVARLPFIYLGLAKDFWYEFDRYLEIEKDEDSTFFVLPFGDTPGRTTSGTAPKIRASAYGAADITERLQAFVDAGREIGLHGIDAWIDSARGQEEKEEIATITGAENIGVRMHWLYFNEKSAAALERAGFMYDSSVGYNEVVGFRTGTTQVYKLLQAEHLLELPLHVMDTTLFYPTYLDLSVEQAKKKVANILDVARKYGGVTTINWHDRSISPERLWGEFYVWLVHEMKDRGAWCTSAGRAVEWFKRRRGIAFYRNGQHLEIRSDHADSDNTPNALHGFRVRVYNSGQQTENRVAGYHETIFGVGTTMSYPGHAGLLA